MTLTIMFIDKCNLRCPMCRHYQNATGEIMSLERFAMILKQIDGLKLLGQQITDIRMDGNREALLYPYFGEALHMIKSKGLTASLVTNGVLLSEDKAKLLVDVGLDGINISVTGVTADVYRHFQGNGNINCGRQLDLVVNNVKRLVKMRNTAKRKMDINISYILSEHSINEANAAIEFWKSCGVDMLGLYRDTNDIVSKLGKNIENIEYQRGGMCVTSSVIAANGDVFPCCQPPGEEMTIGNCFKTPLSEIYQSNAYYGLTSALSTLEYKRLPGGCRTCGVIANLKK